MQLYVYIQGAEKKKPYCTCKDTKILFVFLVFITINPSPTERGHPCFQGP